VPTARFEIHECADNEAVPYPSDMEQVQVHLFAAARAAAGCPVVTVDAGSLREVLDNACVAAPGLADVLPRCSFLIDEVAAHGDHDVVPAGARVDVLPPFAGG
jgi:molybdopterin synthase sulfur carrier subunit